MNILHDAIELIENNLLQEYTLDSLSNELHYSKYHLSREFNTKIGLSIPMYIKLRRMTEAVLLLDDEKYQVSDIAFKCGFNSVSYFIKVFKDTYGITPKEYIKGSYYIQLLNKINIGGNKMFNNIEDINKYLFNEYNNANGVNQLFSTLNNVVLDKTSGTSIDYFALIKDEKGNCLWECNLNLLTGISEKAIIAHDKNNPWISMKKLIKTDSSVSVECYNEKNDSRHQGILMHIGKAEYIVDMCRIGDDYISQMDHYFKEEPSKEALTMMIQKLEGVNNCKNNLELKKYIDSIEHMELVRLVSKKALIVYIINNSKTFSIFDALCNLETKKCLYNYNSGFNNFDKTGTIVWNQGVLEVQLDNKYFSELRLGTGELYKLYNSSYAIEFDSQQRGLSSILFNTK